MVKSEKIKRGYEKLAFGKISDALKLMFAENPTDLELKKMDLFCISEIRRPKDGAMEIKFFDRLRALEKLENMSGTDSGEEIFHAIEEGFRQTNES